MKTSITKGLNNEEKNEIEQDFKASAHLRTRLRYLISEKINTNNVASRSKDSYESPSWAFLQADARGYERALSEIISLLED